VKQRYCITEQPTATRELQGRARAGERKAWVLPKRKRGGRTLLAGEPQETYTSQDSYGEDNCVSNKLNMSTLSLIVSKSCCY